MKKTKTIQSLGAPDPEIHMEEVMWKRYMPEIPKERWIRYECEWRKALRPIGYIWHRYTFVYEEGKEKE